jgi:hypothetical protein
MGAFIVNVNVRSNDRPAVQRAVGALNPAAAWVTGPKNGWVTVYEERASTQDGAWIRQMSERLSGDLRAPVVAFLVHDSDVLCYMLCDGGKLVDEFNSCPDYFGDDDSEADPGASGGRPEVLLKYCAPGTQLADVQRVLGEKDTVFAEEHLGRLAELLGIDPTRAGTDFGWIGDEVEPSELDAVFAGSTPPAAGGGPRRRPALPRLARDEDEDEDEDDDEAGAPRIGGPGGPSVSQVMEMLGLGTAPPPADPLVEGLVKAAAADDVAEIDRLAAAGADVNGTAVLKAAAGTSPVPGGVLTRAGIPFPTTPLMAALTNKHAAAARRLIGLGADVNAGHPILGTPVHAAAGAGDPALLRLVLDSGGDANAKNMHGHTPLESLQHFRRLTSQMSRLGALGAVLGGPLKAQLEKLMPAPEALDECERLLRDRQGGS